MAENKDQKNIGLSEKMHFKMNLLEEKCQEGVEILNIQGIDHRTDFHNQEGTL